MLHSCCQTAFDSWQRDPFRRAVRETKGLARLLPRERSPPSRGLINILIPPERGVAGSTQAGELLASISLLWETQSQQSLHFTPSYCFQQTLKPYSQESLSPDSDI